jgi:excisionase family DNA binding protein
MDLGDKEVLSTFEVAKIVGVHHQTVNSWVRKGWLAAARTPGGHRRIHRDELEKFLRKHQQKTSSYQASEPHSKQVLIVEDDEGTRDVLFKSIRAAFPALDVAYAIDGYDAGRKLSRHVPSLVFLDLMMPGLDGFHVLRDIRSDSRLRNCHVVIITGHHTRENGEEALRNGANLVLTKPIQLKVIHKIVQHLVVEDKSLETLKVPLENVAPFFE